MIMTAKSHSLSVNGAENIYHRTFYSVFYSRRRRQRAAICQDLGTDIMGLDYFVIPYVSPS